MDTDKIKSVVEQKNTNKIKKNTHNQTDLQNIRYTITNDKNKFTLISGTT